MAGIDHTTASVAVRENFSFTEARIAALLPSLIVDSGIGGCVLLSTCNRTELYATHDSGADADPIAILCRVAGTATEINRRYFRLRKEQDAVRHLMEVSGGIVSSVLGDDQIVTQVRSAVETARTAGTVNPILESLFRSAVTAGKRIKTEIRFAHPGNSVALEAINRAERILEGLAGKNALVIGNGVTGRLAAAKLLERGAKVLVTMRTHKPGKHQFVSGCHTVPYDDRYSVMPEQALIVSATSSPHCTIALDKLMELGKYPGLFVDLAVPRDIEEDVLDLPGVKLLNVDNLCSDSAELRQTEQLAVAQTIIGEEEGRFNQWRYNRKERLVRAFAAEDLQYSIPS
jgi:glutamyl-tRNA reductase